MDMDEVRSLYDQALAQPRSDSGIIPECPNLTDVWETIEEAQAREIA